MCFQASVGPCINFIRISRDVEGLTESHDLVSKWDSADKAMMLDGNDAHSYAIPSADEPTVVMLEFFCSRNRRRNDALQLPHRGDLSSNIRITSVCPIPT
jgi:hypothetical protein